MMFYIISDTGSGLKFKRKEEFLEELNLMIEDSIQDGGTYGKRWAEDE